MKIIYRIAKRINSMDDYLTVLLLFSMTVITFVQIVFRYALNHSISWSEELAILMFGWISFLGAASLAKRGEHFGFDNVVVLLPKKGQFIVDIFSDVISCTFIAFFTVSGSILFLRGSSSMTGALGISMRLPFLVMPLSGFAYFCRVLALLIRKIKNVPERI